jgi:hypothetical protein
VDADDSARMRDLLADSRTLLAWIRTALAFAGLGFAVAKFGRTPGLAHVAGYFGMIMALVGLLFTIMGYAQQRIVLTEEKPAPGAPVPLDGPQMWRPPPAPWPACCWPRTSPSARPE